MKTLNHDDSSDEVAMETDASVTGFTDDGLATMVEPLPELSPVHSPASNDDVTPITRRQSLRSTTSNASVKSLIRTSSVKNSKLQKQNTKIMDDPTDAALTTGLLSKSSVFSTGSNIASERSLRSQRSQNSNTGLITPSAGIRSKSSIARDLFGSDSTASERSLRSQSSRRSNSVVSQRSDVNLNKTSSLNLSQEVAMTVNNTDEHEKSAEDEVEKTGDDEQPMDADDSGDAAVTSSTTDEAIPAFNPVFTGPPPIEIAISFDTTGSMSQCIEQVQAQVQHIIQRLFMDIPNLKIAVIAHGDYCDAEHFYVTREMDFTNDLASLCTFVKDVGGTGGGDWEECYELVLQKVRTELSWSPGSQRALVMIGDAIPHPHGVLSRNINWEEEADRLYNEVGVRVYGVQCLSEEKATPFWADLAKRTHGKHLRLDQFTTIVDMLMAIVYREHGADFFEAYEKEVRCREGPGIRTELDTMFANLRNGATPSTSTAATSAKKKRYAKGAAKASKTKVPKTPTTPKKGKTAMPKKVPKTAGVIKNKNVKTLTTTKGGKPKKSSKSKKGTKKNVKALRETTSAHKFALSKLSWSPWKPGMAASVPSKNGKGWIKQRSFLNGVRKAELFKDAKQRPAVYEFAVQPAPRRKLYTVYFRVAKAIPQHCRWDRHLLNSKLAISQLKKVLENPTATLFVRRAFIPKKVRVQGSVLNNAYEARRFLGKRYDYAWLSRRSSGSTGRKVTRCKCAISSAL